MRAAPSVLSPVVSAAGLPASPRPFPTVTADPGNPSRCFPDLSLIEANLEARLSTQRIHQHLLAEVGDFDTRVSPVAGPFGSDQ